MKGLQPKKQRKMVTVEWLIFPCFIFPEKFAILQYSSYNMQIYGDTTKMWTLNKSTTLFPYKTGAMARTPRQACEKVASDLRLGVCFFYHEQLLGLVIANNIGENEKMNEIQKKTITMHTWLEAEQGDRLDAILNLPQPYLHKVL